MPPALKLRSNFLNTGFDCMSGSRSHVRLFYPRYDCSISCTIDPLSEFLSQVRSIPSPVTLIPYPGSDDRLEWPNFAQGRCDAFASRQPHSQPPPHGVYSAALRPRASTKFQRSDGGWRCHCININKERRTPLGGSDTHACGVWRVVGISITTT